MVDIIAASDDREESESIESPVTDIQWDPNSSDYALVLWYQSDAVLLETNRYRNNIYITL